jgi:hypothetical protein
MCTLGGAQSTAYPTGKSYPIGRLLGSHAQWAFRNATVHLEVKDGRTAAAHETILNTMEGFLHTDLEQLLK